MKIGDNVIVKPYNDQGVIVSINEDRGTVIVDRGNQDLFQYLIRDVVVVREEKPRRDRSKH